MFQSHRILTLFGIGIGLAISTILLLQSIPMTGAADVVACGGKFRPPCPQTTCVDDWRDECEGGADCPKFCDRPISKSLRDGCCAQCLNDQICNFETCECLTAPSNGVPVPPVTSTPPPPPPPHPASSADSSDGVAADGCTHFDVSIHDNHNNNNDEIDVIDHSEGVSGDNDQEEEEENDDHDTKTFHKAKKCPTQCPAGPRGPRGKQGKRGPTGRCGKDGQDGRRGPAGAQGIQGVAGVTGAAGPQGPQGLTGPAGTPGIPGTFGPKGDPGLTGTQGTQGDVGPGGPQGLTGPQGPAGVCPCPCPSGNSCGCGKSVAVHRQHSTLFRVELMGCESFTLGVWPSTPQRVPCRTLAMTKFDPLTQIRVGYNDNFEAGGLDTCVWEVRYALSATDPGPVPTNWAQCHLPLLSVVTSNNSPFEPRQSSAFGFCSGPSGAPLPAGPVIFSVWTYDIPGFFFQQGCYSGIGSSGGLPLQYVALEAEEVKLLF